MGTLLPGFAVGWEAGQPLDDHRATEETGERFLVF